MPLTEFQQELLAVLAADRSEERYLAGGAALHFAPNSTRYRNDLDFFHDSVERVASTFETDRALLATSGYAVNVELSQPGFIRATISRGSNATRVDWAHDSAWRFLPLERDPLGGLMLHPVDLAINKVLVLSGRDEPRDFVDILFVHDRVLPLGALCWAAVGKDPGFTPLSLLELLKRRGRYRSEEFGRLHLTEPFDLVAAKTKWLTALSAAEAFVHSRPPDEFGCLYWDAERTEFVAPGPHDMSPVVPHYGVPGGVVPRVSDQTNDLRDQLQTDV